jgi:hypothetical protein
VVGPFDDPNLASHILMMVPRNWQDQYELAGATVPQSIRERLEALEGIERAFPTNKVGDGPKTTAKSSNSSKRKIVSFDERIPKKCRREKHCLLCKKHGGAHTTREVNKHLVKKPFSILKISTVAARARRIYLCYNP